MENILESTEKVEVNSQTPQVGDERIQHDSLGLGFAEPDVVVSMMNTLGIDATKIDSETADRMKSIYELSKNQPLSIEEYLTESGRRIGGKFTPGYLGKLYVYLTMLDRENSLRNEETY